MKAMRPKVLLFMDFRHCQSFIVNSNGSPKLKFNIFDSLEKLITLLIPNDFKWDGIFGGNFLFLNVIYLRKEFIFSVKQKDNRKTLPQKDR